MALKIQKGITPGPIFITIYGPTKIGKSLLASMAPKSLMLCVESDGANYIDAHKVTDIDSTDEFSRLCKQASREPDYDWIIVDNITKLESIARAEILKRLRITTIAAAAHGKGYTALSDAVMGCINEIQAMRDNGKSVCVLAHAHTKTALNVQVQEDMSQISIALRHDAAECLQRFCDGLYYMDFQKRKIKNKSSKRRDADTVYVNQQTRVLYTGYTQGVATGSNITGMPDEMTFIKPKDYAKFWDKITNAGSGKPKRAKVARDKKSNASDTG